MAAVLAAFATVSFAEGGDSAPPADPNRTENYQGPKKGTFTGIVTKSEQSHRLVVTNAKGEVRHFFPHWIGGMPADGGGFDKGMMEQFGKLGAGDKVEVKWVADERFRAVTVKVLAKAEAKAEVEKK